MEYINKNEDLIEQSVTEKFYPLNAIVIRFDIYQQDHRLYIDVYFSLPYHRFQSEKILKLSFIDVIEYSFYWNAADYFYNVERCKFFKSGKGYYMSLDPANESEELTEEDQDIILSKELEGYFM
ncbi:hypothetical protein [Mucilaginibacter polytrichastri]|uniref:Uncharacterized protein n=1 Tax=Mucilaginibacter polytrichastri TaxID=1302689 RepID=A0A1Q6A2U7_9SPHI|nr:hypothetical protein [Mucilaginibacter polytrichastri]OKS88336.1 hypothetical protein RG47T_3802 [Mucilaginibacter polytrichastri]SFT13821.1 hypothetical protein SAMN04487890_11273 [Mucilaginibacter polytrichastri]